MLVGKFPTKQFLTKYKLDKEYEGISESCMNGDIASFEKHMDQNMQLFIESGVYFALEKLN